MRIIMIITIIIRLSYKQKSEGKDLREKTIELIKNDKISFSELKQMEIKEETNISKTKIVKSIKQEQEFSEIDNNMTSISNPSQ